jgi:hypothetical protein
VGAWGKASHVRPWRAPLSRSFTLPPAGTRRHPSPPPPAPDTSVDGYPNSRLRALDAGPPLAWALDAATDVACRRWRNGWGAARRRPSLAPGWPWHATPRARTRPPAHLGLALEDPDLLSAPQRQAPGKAAGYWVRNSKAGAGSGVPSRGSARGPRYPHPDVIHRARSAPPCRVSARECTSDS